MLKIGIAGYGTMGSILGKVLHEHAQVAQVFATRKGRSGVSPALAVPGNAALARECDVVVLCVKPAQALAVAREIAPHVAGRIVISIAAKVPIAHLRAILGEECAIVRATPNTPCRIGQGVTLLAADPPSGAHLELAQSLFADFGMVVNVPESLLNAGTALSGCGPAYMYEIVEALCDGAVKLGLARSVARTLAAHTMAGAAQMILQSGTHPAELQDEVVTPGGCTIAGLMVLRDAGVRPALARAVVAAGA